MLTKNDCLSILVNLEKEGISINAQMKKLLVSKEIPIEVLKFISQHRGIDVTAFYEMLRKKHNQNHSPLYTNILKNELDEEKIVTTLSCLLVQIVLYSNKLDEAHKSIFYREARAAEITKALDQYFSIGNFETCISLLSLIKTDLMVVEYLDDKRMLNET